MRARLDAARDRLRRGRPIQPGKGGPSDPETGESWDGLNVLGHVAEFLPYWTGELTRAMATGGTFGRDEAGYAARRRSIDSGPERGERALRETVESGCGQVATFLDGLDPADLARQVDHAGRGPISLGTAIESFLIGHLEAHVEQLQSLG